MVDEGITPAISSMEWMVTAADVAGAVGSRSMES